MDVVCIPVESAFETRKLESVGESEDEKSAKVVKRKKQPSVH
jgi:hypothetical protein